MGETCPGEIRSILPGTIVSYAVEVGQSVKVGKLLLVQESMKMQNHIVSGCRSCNRIKCYSRRTFGEGGLDVDNKNRIGIVTKYKKESVAMLP
ncbi:MAG: acetyl-CoA carboxylase biotin carboxyl carrier protein subunit [Coprobacter fastidiosus]